MDDALDVRVTALEAGAGGHGEEIKELQRQVKVQEDDGHGHVRTKGTYVDGIENTIGENVMKLDDAIGNVSEGHYVEASVDAEGKLKTTMAQNVENLDNALYKTREAFGGSFDTDGEWTAQIEASTEAGAVSYGTFTVHKVKYALDQIVTNIGDGGALGDEGMNGVLKSNTINQNIAAVNDIIGNFSEDLNFASTNITNGKEGDPGYKVPENVIDVLNNIDATLGTVHGLTDKLREAGTYKGNLAESGTVENHYAALDTAIGNRAEMNNTSFTGYTNIGGMNTAQALTSIASSVGTADDLGASMNGVSVQNTVNKNIAALNSAIGDLGDLGNTYYTSEATNVVDAVRTLDSNMYRLDTQVANLDNKYRKLNREYRSGMASMAAMSALVPNARAYGNTQLAIGTGAYSSHTAAAIGGFHWLTDNLLLNVGVAWGNSSDEAYRMGVTYTW